MKLDERRRDALHDYDKLLGRHQKDSRPAIHTPYAFGHFKGRGRLGCLIFFGARLVELAAPRTRNAQGRRDIGDGGWRNAWAGGKGADLTPPCVSSLASPHRPKASAGVLEPRRREYL